MAMDIRMSDSPVSVPARNLKRAWTPARSYSMEAGRGSTNGGSGEDGRVRPFARLGVVSEAVRAGRAFGAVEDDQHDRADYWDEAEQDRPARAVGVVQAAHGDGDAGDEQRKREQAVEGEDRH